MRSRPGQLHSIRRKRQHRFERQIEKAWDKLDFSPIYVDQPAIVDYTKIHGRVH